MVTPVSAAEGGAISASTSSSTVESVSSVETPMSEPPSFETATAPVLPAPARLAPLDVGSSSTPKVTATAKAPSISPSSSSEQIGRSPPSIRYAPSTSTSSFHSGVLGRSRASLQSGQVDIEVKRGPHSQMSRSHSSIISRDLVPDLPHGGSGESGRFQSLKNALDWRFLLTIINPIEYVWPMTLRRILFWIFYGGIATGLYFLNKYYHWASGMSWAFRYQSIIAMSLIYGLEPLFMLLLYLIARLPEASKHILPTMCVRCLVDLEDGPATPSNSESTALVIPCHNTDLVAFFNVLKGAFKHFQPEQIFVVENGNTPTPPNSELQDFCRRIDPRIVYIWSPVASKNAAQYVGTLAAHSYDYIMTTDDDVVVPWNYRSPTELITEETKAVCFPIGARVARQQSWAGADSLVVSWQDIEFKASGLIKTAEAQLCGVLYPHGACSFWERETFLDVLRMHSLVFYGEDTQMGFALQRMGKMIAIDASIILQTEVPASFLGPPLNYWQQRVRSWEMGRMSMIFKFISHFFRVNGQRTITGFLAQKILQFYSLYSIACDLIRVPLFVIMYSRPGFWQKFALFSLVPILPPLFYKFIKARHRPDLEPALIPVLTFPLYKAVYQVVSCFGALRCIFYYWPSLKHTKTIKELEREDAFWLDERFIQDPGYLARKEGDISSSNEKGSDLSSNSNTAKEVEDAKHAEALAAADERADNVAELADQAEFDVRSHASRAMTTRSRGRYSAINGLLDYDTTSIMGEKQRRMEQHLLRLEGSLGRVESMLFDLNKRV